MSLLGYRKQTMGRNRGSVALCEGGARTPVSTETVIRCAGGEVNMKGAKVVKVDELKYLRSTIQRVEEWSAGRVEWVEENVRGDL